MFYVALYLSMLVIGYLGGYRMRNRRIGEKASEVIMMVFISLLVLIMGLRMGSNQQVIDNIGPIGLISLAFTVLLWIGTCFAVSVARRLMRLDKWGFLHEKTAGGQGSLTGDGDTPEETVMLKHIDDVEENADRKTGNDNSMTRLILLMLALGLAIGFFGIRTVLDHEQMLVFDDLSSKALVVGLCIMILAIGYGMGLSGEVIRALSKIGARVLVIPVAILVGTTISAILIGLIFPQITVRESMAIGYGYGWYTYAPICIGHAGHQVASAISFMHNVLRELGGIVLIPVLAKRIGYIETASIPGICVMDVALPILQRATRDEIIAYAFAIGLFEELFTTVLVPLAIG